jgi:MSHA biogenesis protein MshI
MQIGWRRFIKGLFKKAPKFHSVGIEIGANNVNISTLVKHKGELNWIKQHSAPIDNWQTALKDYVESNHLTHTQCHIALSISKYHLLQIDRPAVEDAELNQALQWAVKDQLASEDELVIDYFDPPAAHSVTKLNVVAVNKQHIIDIRNGVIKAGLALNTIGIAELAICNLLASSEDAIITLKQEDGGQLILNIVKRKQLFFSRRLRGYENLANFSPEELKMGVVDNLSLEIQRSMDYFESQLRQAPIKKVYISLDTVHQDPIADLIKEVILISVEKFIPDVTTTDEMPVTPSSYASLGAAMHNASLIV